MTRHPEERWIPEDTFGDRIRRIRRNVHLSQTEFARRLRTGDNPISDRTVAAWETGGRMPRSAVTIAKRVELAFGVPATWLLGLDGGGVTPPQGDPSTTDRYSILRVA